MAKSYRDEMLEDSRKMLKGQENQQKEFAALRTENERLRLIVAELEGWNGNKTAQIATLRAALREIEFTTRTGVMAGSETGSDPLHMTKDEVLTYCFDTAGAALEDEPKGDS